MYKLGKDDKYVGIFLEEVLFLIEILEKNIVKLEEEYQVDTLNTIIKIINDIKCISAAMGLRDMYEISYNLESFLSRVAQSKIRIDDRIIKMLMDSLGEFKGIYFLLCIDYRYNPAMYYDDYKTGDTLSKKIEKGISMKASKKTRL